MLICNNCNTVNEDNSLKCKNCQMAGYFRPQIGDNKSDDTPVLQVKVLCRNCGSDSPGEDTRCVHCRFPLPRQVGAPMRSERQLGEVSWKIPSIEKQ